MAELHTFIGKSGTPYEFEMFPIPTEFRPVSGVYIFCSYTILGSWVPLYVGEAESLYDRVYAGLANHDGYKRARLAGANHIGALIVDGKSTRLAVETDLRHGLNPSCNLQGLGGLFDAG